jgi:hypothetical protein
LDWRYNFLGLGYKAEVNFMEEFMPVDSQTALSWVALLAVVFSVLLGVIVLSTVCRLTWKKLAISGFSLAFAIVGAILITTPKWTQIAIEWGDMKIKIARVKILEAEVAELTKERETMTQRINEASSKVDAQALDLANLRAENVKLAAQNTEARSVLTNVVTESSKWKTEPWRVDGAVGTVEQILKGWQTP